MVKGRIPDTGYGLAGMIIAVVLLLGLIKALELFLKVPHVLP